MIRYRSYAKIGALALLPLLGCGDNEPPTTGPDLVVTAVSATLAAEQIYEGELTVITVTVTLSDGSTVSAGPTGPYIPTFTTDNGSVATVTDGGTVEAVGPGRAFIQTKVGSVATTDEVTVLARPVALIEAREHGTSAVAGESLDVLFRLVDARSDGLAGYDVTFAIVEGSGSVTPSNVSTDSEGHAAAVWTLGPGVNRLEAASEALDPVVLSATGTVNTVTPTAIGVAGGSGQSGTVGTPLTQDLAVRVSGPGGAPVSGVVVQWTTGDGIFGSGPDAAAPLSDTQPYVGPPGTSQLSRDALSAARPSAQSSTNAEGIATIRWTLGTQAGTQQVTASVNALVTTFTATAQPASATSIAVSPDSATVQVGNSVTFSATLTDQYGNATAGAVSWSSDNTSVATVNGGGAVSGIAEGAATITASSASLSDSGRVGVVAQASPVATTLERQSGDGQSGTVGTTLPNPITVTLRDQFGATMEGITVTWSSATGSGSASATTTSTDGSGQASVSWTLGDSPGTHQLTATVSGLDPVTFTATATPMSTGGPVRIPAGSDIQPIVDVHPAGTEFILEAGEHRRQTVYPRDGDTFRGESGTVLDGRDNTDYAFRWREAGNGLPAQYPKNVTIRNMEIRNYRGTDQMGPILAGWHINKPEAFNGSSGWVVENNHIHNNHFAGVRIGRNMRVRNNNIHHNGQVGVTGIGSGVVVEGNQLNNNGYNHPRGADYGPGVAWKEAGVKVVSSDNVTIRNNTANNNHGMGIWVDDDVRFISIQGNQASGNAIAGILVEKSYTAEVNNNTLSGNGTSTCNGNCLGLHGAGIFVQNSSDVDIHHNTVSANRNAITVTLQNRGNGKYGLWDTKNVYVHHNTMQITQGGQKVGFSDDSGQPAKYSLDTVCYDYNTYTLPGGYAGFWWQTSPGSSNSTGYNWGAWRGFGQDKNSALGGPAGSGSSGC